MTRRRLLSSTFASGALAAQTKARSNIVISSSNGLACCDRAMEILDSGGDTLDAVIAGVNIQELDAEDTSVGYGGLPNERGVVELDSCVMHGPTRRAGAVASLRGIKTPSKIAKLVMERTDHVMMVSDGALEFAKVHGFAEEDLLAPKARMAWLKWKESQGSDWGPGLDAPDGGQALGPGEEPEWAEWAKSVVADPPTGTINCLALNLRGEMSGCTTTSGLAWKIPGRVGDSPIIGAGLYVDQDIGGAGSTGRGEENIRVCGAHTVVENMRHGMSPQDACLDTLERVARNYRALPDRLEQVGLFFYALRNDGEYAAASLWSSRDGKRRQFVVNDGSGARRVDAAYVRER